jgi:class 3 adenylate cyclase
MTCPRCGTVNSVGRRFCAECGSSLALACPSCGFSNEPGVTFCGGCGATLGGSPPKAGSRFAAPETYTPKYLAEKIVTSKAALEGERKQVTVLFADLKGSMELLADRDPEEAQKILDPVLEHMMEAVHRYEGTVNQVMGDGIMALFGAPLAHEDHAVRACYAALRMQESVKKYADEVRRSHAAVVKIRVGLNSGEVVVRAIGSDLHMDYTAVGQTTHLAARMEQLADPGAIVIAPETLSLAEGYVDVKPLGPIQVKGLGGQVTSRPSTRAPPPRVPPPLPSRPHLRTQDFPRSRRHGRMSVDHLFCLQQDAWRNVQAERLRSREIDNQLQPARLLHGEVGGLRTPEDLVHEHGSQAEDLAAWRAIAHEKPGLGERAVGRHQRQPSLERELGDAVRVREEHRIEQHEGRVGGDAAERGFEIVRATDVNDHELHTELPGGGVHVLSEEAVRGIALRPDQSERAERRQKLLREPGLLLHELLPEYGHTGDVPARTSEALHQPGSHCVGPGGHDDGHGSGGVLRGTDSRGALRHYDIDLSPEQLGNER